MLVTFYLSGPYSSTTVSSQFTIVGNPGAETFTGITKTQLLSGHPLTFSESVTGGTVTTTEPETCVGTVVNWLVNPEPTPTPTPTTVELQVYGKDEYITPQNATMTYTVNGGSSFNLITLEPLPSNCGLIGTISGLALNDVVVITSVDTYPMLGVGSSTCPTLTGTATSYTHTVGVSSGFDYVAITINSNVSV